MQSALFILETQVLTKRTKCALMHSFVFLSKIMESRLQKQKIYKILNGYGSKLLNLYIEKGPSELREKLGIQSDDVWKIVFHYLVREKEAVKHCVRMHSEYIHELFAEKGPNMIRKVFEITEEIFDDEWEYVMDYVGISRGALYEYVSENKEKFRDLIYNGRSSKIRETLCIDKEKYNRTWETILDMLLECVATDVYTYNMYEQGISMFTRFYNEGRKHRPIKRQLLADANVITDPHVEE
jgi:hypothetical protein